MTKELKEQPSGTVTINGSNGDDLKQGELNSPNQWERSILFISPQPFLTHRGSPFRVLSTVTSLVKMGHQIDLLVLPFGNDVFIPGVNIIRTPRLPFVTSIPIGPSFTKLVYDVLIGFHALILLLKKRYLIVHGIEEGGYIAALLTPLFKLPYVFDMHSSIADQLRAHRLIWWRLVGKLVARLEQACIRRASAVVTVGDELTNRARFFAPQVPGCSLQDLPLEGVETVNEEMVRIIRDEFALHDRRVFLYTGNFEPYQGIDLLIRAFAVAVEQSNRRLAESTGEAVLLLVGGGEGSNNHLSFYRNLAEQLGVGNRVVFTGQRPAEEMGPFMTVADLLVSPRIEGNNPPLKIYSYMAAGKPIIATRITSHTQVLDEETAILASASVESFAEALLLGFDDSDESASLKRRIVAQAKRKIETQYSRDEFLRRLGKLYADVGISLPDHKLVA